MKVCILGTGYVGLVTGACFANMGNDVICADIDEKRIEGLNKGEVELPFWEPGLDDLVRDCARAGRLTFTSDIGEAIRAAAFQFIAVGTPQGDDGAADLSAVFAAAREIGRNIASYSVVVDKSTMPVGTAAKVKAIVAEEVERRVARGEERVEFDVVSNPEFLKQGSAVLDFEKPDRIVIGVDGERSEKLMRELYAQFVRSNNPILVMDIPSAEMTKYAANAMLATRISFMNEMAQICERVGADITHVRAGIGSDERIGQKFLYAGLGYGGSCFPKDVQALYHRALEADYGPKILKAVHEVNQSQKGFMARRLIKHFENGHGRGETPPPGECRVALWGLSFKPETDDMREAPSLVIMDILTEAGMRVSVFDPKAMGKGLEAIEKFIPADRRERIEPAGDMYDALSGADALFLVTEWNEFRSPDFGRIKELLKTPVIFDGRNIFDPKRMIESGFDYHCIGRLLEKP